RHRGSRRLRAPKQAIVWIGEVNSPRNERHCRRATFRTVLDAKGTSGWSRRCEPMHNAATEAALPTMPQMYCPRVSEAMRLLPELRGHLVAAAPHFPVPIDLSLDLLPIVEDGIFGYELVPDRETRTCLTIGFNEAGVPVLRKTSYGTVVPSALRLAMQ